MRKQSKELFLFLLLLNRKLNEVSNDIYDNLLKDLLQEQSHSFGFKPLSDISDYLEEEIYKLYKENDIFFEYIQTGEGNIYFQENHKEINVKIMNEEQLFNILNFCYIDNLSKEDYSLREVQDYFILENIEPIDFTSELFIILENVVKKLKEIEYKLGNQFRLLLTDLKDDTALHSFNPIYNIKEFIYVYVDKFMLRIENNWLDLNEEEIQDRVDNGDGLFYLFCEVADFGDIKMNIYIGEKTISLKDKNIISLLEELS